MTSIPDSDEALMARYARGDPAAFEQLYRRHELRVWHYLERHSGNRATAEELMQEVWFAVARDSIRYQPTARFTTWLFTIAHNRLVDSYRTRRREVSLDAPATECAVQPPELTSHPNADPLAQAVAQDEAGALRRAIAGLPAEQRTAFLLQMEGDLGVEEIAAITGSSFETTKSRLRYARNRLRDSLQEHAR